MPHSFVLLTYRDVCLIVCIAEAVRRIFDALRMLFIEIVWSGSSFIYKETSQVEIFFISCRLI